MSVDRSQTPEGFRYLPNFLSVAEESDLLREIEGLSFNEVRMHGIVAKRRVKHYGWLYGYESWQVTPAPAIPDWLLALQERVASLLGVSCEGVDEVLISQ